MIIVTFVLYKTTFGYESKMTGLNQDFATYGGVKSRKIMYFTMFFSGALAGLGGVLEVLGIRFLYLHEMLRSPAYAWTGLMAALISNFNPIGTVLCAIFLAGMQIGGAALERRSSIPLEITSIIQAVVILLISVKLLSRILIAARNRRLAKGGQKSES
jgi:simple sugar transport system permease protein